MKSTIVIAALVASALGVTSVVPSLAQDAPAPSTPPAVAPAQPAPPAATTPDTAPKPMHRFARRSGGMGGGMGGMNRGGGRLVALACSDRGAVVLQHLLDRSARRLDLTADQQKLFDAFRDKALITATSFSQQCQAARPDRSKGRPDLITRLQAGLAVDQARITALNAVLPDFKALFDSLTPQQKAHLRPMLGQGGMGQGKLGKGPGMGNRGGQGPHWGNHDDSRASQSSAT